MSGCAGQAQETGGTLEIHFLDVGQGDAILIRSPDGRNVRVDGGREDEALDYLRSIGVESVYMVIASHADADHIGGLEAVVRHYRPQLFMDNQIPSETQTYEGLLSGVVEAGSQVATPTARRVNLGDASLQVIPPPGIGEWGGNDNSVGLLVEYGAFRAGLTGDAEDNEFGWWLQNVPELLEPVSVYKASHHGSKNGDTEEGVAAFAPESVVISVGFENSYGHPDAEALALYRSVGADIYRTDESGTVIVRASPDGTYTVNAAASTAGGGEAREPEAVPNVTALPYDPAGPDRDCGEFSTQAEAQAFFEAAGGPKSDPHRLDANSDSVVCESLP